MFIHQAPVSSFEYENEYFHIEFYPPLRTAEKIKYYASSGMEAGNNCNFIAAEDIAKH